jgi:hypothetical protein
VIDLSIPFSRHPTEADELIIGWACDTVLLALRTTVVIDGEPSLESLRLAQQTVSHVLTPMIKPFAAAFPDDAPAARRQFIADVLAAATAIVARHAPGEATS